MTFRWNRLLAGALCTLAAAGLAAPAHAADYPERPIRLVLPYPPGGPTDLLARVVAMEMSQSLGQQVVVDNRPGASGMIGAEAVARAKPDGYTFLANASLHVINPTIYPEMRYDALQDFAPITQLADVPLVLVVPANGTIRSVQDVVASAKARDGGLSFGSAGTASSQQLAGESFRMATGLPMLHVPYKGSAPALADLIGGQLDFMFDSMPSAMPFIQSGQLRAIAVTTPQRVPALPDVPTVAESGYPGFAISTWYGFWAPQGTPEEIVQTLSEHAARALALPQVKERYASMGAQPVGSSPADFAAYQAREMEKWADVVRRAGIEMATP
ncbi:tripartite tricarboxylate transporter substrate binding protein [Verticiella sediminum]|uniref:Tripartite tricarboxylate transporter substrate binding protein n=1 Tax=Verticiella sediminum TaxID=1247510 RepID=A0A556ABL0_9BURK|nr:tripartite tricarboxylate transporter substrate binding protein [Verticiella sediminum]TSH90260.1 tripartite tricarboxylate transporter substrate binding protein [Verticiella sediminum]